MSQTAGELHRIFLPKTTSMTVCTDRHGMYWEETPNGFAYVLNRIPCDGGMPELYGCIDTRPMGGLLDWQTIPDGEFDARLSTVIEERIRPLMTLPLSEIAQNPTLFGKPCLCEPRRCADCWYPEA